MPTVISEGYPHECIHELFEAQAEIRGDSAALVFGDQCLTYAEANVRANQLARYLRRFGAAPEQFVGTCLDGSMHAAIAALAILKSGAAYISLASHPQHRLKEMIGDAGLRLVIASPVLRGQLSIDGISWVCPEEDMDAIQKEGTCNIASGVVPDNAAFIRYTSGSTGKPRAAVNIHRSLTSRLHSGPLPDIREDDICLVKAASGSRLFVPLAVGATVVVVSADEVQDARILASRIAQHQVTSIYVVPTLLRQLLTLDKTTVAGMQVLRVVTTGGESIAPDVIRRFREVMPQTLLMSLYGSTEIGTTASMRIITNDETWRLIGKPVANTEVHLFDERQYLVPPGETGEICVGSSHLARGYLFRPDLTAGQFIPDPISRYPGRRMYRTGDTGRSVENDDIEFAGRADHQVKIRGFRVELEEIQVILQSCDDVQECVVTARQTGHDTRLAAYIVARAGANPRPKVLRVHLQKYLPDYAIPSNFVLLDHIPKTDRGKVDRQALPALDSGRPDLDNAYAPPRSPFEAALAEMWASLLEVGTVGIHDNFLELGGDSLIIGRVVARIGQEFSLDVPMTLLLERPTVAELARELTSRLNAETQSQGAF